MPEPTRADIRRAIKALGINVPIYQVEAIPGGVRFYLYGHKKPMDWKRPRKRRTKAKPKPKVTPLDMK